VRVQSADQIRSCSGRRNGAAWSEQEQLLGGVEADGAGALLVQQLLGAGDDALHRGVPVGLHQLAVDADERTRQPIREALACQPNKSLGPRRPWFTRSSVRPRTPTIRSSRTAMSMASPLECWSWVTSGEVGRLLDWGSVSVYRDVVGTAQRRLLLLAGAGSLSVPAAGLPTVQALTTRGGRR